MFDKKTDLDLFFIEYHKIRKDDSLRERGEIATKALIYCDFIWEILRSLEIKHGDMLPKYQKEAIVLSHVNKARYYFKRTVKEGMIPEKYTNFSIRNIIK